MEPYIKYPKCLASTGRNDGLVFAVNSNLRPMEQADINEGKSPLTTFKGWASLELNFAEAAEKSGGSGNIETTHIADVKLRTEIAMQAVMEAEAEQKQNEKGASHAQSILNTKVLFLPIDMKSYAGKSAYEIAELAGPNEARRAASNLSQTASASGRYAKSNQKQAEALNLAAIIIEAKSTLCPNGKSVAEIFSGDIRKALAYASKLFNDRNPVTPVMTSLYEAMQADPSVKDVLAQKAPSTGKTYRIYGPVFKTPNTKKVDEDGYTKAYQLAVTCDPSRTDAPFRVELTTMLGIPDPKNAVGVSGQSIKDRKNFKIDLQSWEWVNMIDRADGEKRMVESMFHDAAYQIMVQADTDNFHSRRNTRQ